MFFNPINAIMAAIADTLQKDYGTLQSYWNTIAVQSQERAYQLIIQALTAKGYTQSQIQGWDAGATWERDLTLWFALRRAAAMQGVEERTIGMFDVRKDLNELPGIVVGGVYQYPAGDPGTVGVGDMDVSSDVFQMPPSDPGCSGDFIIPTGERGDPTVL